MAVLLKLGESVQKSPQAVKCLSLRYALSLFIPHTLARASRSIGEHGPCSSAEIPLSKWSTGSQLPSFLSWYIEAVMPLGLAENTKCVGCLGLNVFRVVTADMVWMSFWLMASLSSVLKNCFLCQPSS